MSLKPSNQTNLYGLDFYFQEFINLFNKNKLPNKILLSGYKGIGKSTLAFHLINYVLSKDEDYSYDFKNNKINSDNKSYKLIQNSSHPNFILIDIMSEKKIIDIAQIRNMISNLNKSSFNSKPRFILIDNIEFFNLNSTNALLKILEEPPINCFFVLVNNNRKIIPTLKSRCINFKIDLTNKESYSIANKLIDTDTFDLINKELLDYYFTPGKIYNLVKFSNENKINLKTINLEKFLTFIIQENYYKKESPIRYMVYDFVELLLKKKINIENSNFIKKFSKKIGNTKKLNLDEESLFMELDSKILNV